jgi:glutathione S-transferase
MWADWAKINVALAFTVPIFWRVVRTPPKDMNCPAVRDAITALGKKLDIAEARLQTRSFICGDDLTLADVQLGHVLYRYFDIPIERPEHPALQRYYDRLSKRTAFREHVMVSYDELRAA